VVSSVLDGRCLCAFSDVCPEDEHGRPALDLLYQAIAIGVVMAALTAFITLRSSRH